MVSDNSLSRCPADLEAVAHLKQAVADGKHWYLALLEAIGLWGSVEEVYDGQHYRYLIGNEAFDWLLLAERLCLEVDGVVPEHEKVGLLFSGKPPIELSRKEFSSLIGEAKYRAYLNYVYGVVVEQALVSAVEEEVRKDFSSLTASRHAALEQEAYRRIYGADTTALLRRFRQEAGYADAESISLTEEKEFTYWLFNYRVQNSDKERVASDTRKALQWLQHQRSRAGMPGGDKGENPSHPASGGDATHPSSL